MRIIRVVPCCYLHNQSPSGSPPALEPTCTAGAALFLYPYTPTQPPFNCYSRAVPLNRQHAPRAKPRQIGNANAPKRTRTQPYACVFLKQISPEIWLPEKGNTTCQEKNGTLFASPYCAAERQAVMLSCNELRREVKASSRKDDEASLNCTSKTSKHRSCHGLDLVESRQGSAAAVRDLDARLEVAVDVHEAPFVLPFFALFVVADLPGFVEGREPKQAIVSIQKSLKKQGATYQKYSV